MGTRKSFVAGVATFTLVPAFARAADEKRSFRVKARFDINRDKKTLRQVEVVVVDGKSGNALDGSWAYDRMPRTPRGLYVVCTVTDGPKLHLKLDAEYGSADNEAAGGSNFTVTDAKNTIDEDVVAGQPIAYPWTIRGEDYTLTVTVEPVAPKDK